MIFSLSIYGDGGLSLMEQIKKMIVYAIDHAVKDLKALVKCS